MAAWRWLRARTRSGSGASARADVAGRRSRRASRARPSDMITSPDGSSLTEGARAEEATLLPRPVRLGVQPVALEPLLDERAGLAGGPRHGADVALVRLE